MKSFYQNKSAILSKDNKSKIKFNLLKHAYMQSSTALFASFFCALILLIGLYKPNTDNRILIFWSALIVTIMILRLGITFTYKHYNYPEYDYPFWRNLYILGCILGGLSWGIAGILLLPSIDPSEQIILIMILAGITAGSVPVTGTIPIASIGFLVCAIVPFIVSIITFLSGETYILFNLTLTLYLLYLIALTFRTYHTIRNSIILRYENDILLSNLELTNQKLEYAATHDPLTAVPNRRLFLQNLAQTIEYAKQNKKIFALLYIDLDRFKEVNDKYGHHVGDLILVTVFNRLKVYFKRDDIIARIGGDELAIIIEKLKAISGIESVAQAICNLIAEPIIIDNNSIHISASIGISIYPYDGLDEDSLLHNSDKYMYHVKKHGGNNFYYARNLEKV